MTSFTLLRNLTSIALAACCVLGTANARAQTYTLTDLGVIPGQKADSGSLPAGINDKAQVTGTSGTFAFRYTSAKTAMENVGGNPAESISRGFGINGLGQVVGDWTFGENKASHAAIFSNGSATDLGTLAYAGFFSRANGVNAFGQVVGFASDKRDGNNSRAFIAGMANSHQLTDLGTLGGAYAQAFGINNSGSVTGNAQTSDTSRSGASHAFIWHAKMKMLDLGTLAGRFSYGTAINANDHVVGYSTINSVDERFHAFLHNGKQMIDLGSLSGASSDTDLSFALGVNSADQVVGYSYLPMESKQGSVNVVLGPWPVAFIYSQGLMVNLNDLIGTASENYRLDSATGINDNGQIAAIAFDRSADAFHAVLLSPAASDPAPNR